MKNSQRKSDSPYIEIDENKEIRCVQCNKLFGKGNLGEDTKIELKCIRCKTINRFRRL